MIVFSFHAETSGDVELLTKTVKDKGFKFDITVKPDPMGLPYLDVEGTTDMSFKELKDIVESQADGHVIARTISNMTFAEVKEMNKNAGTQSSSS